MRNHLTINTLAILGLLIVISCTRTIEEETSPNIIIINIDDMGWRDTGFMGSEYYSTPHIDRLASSGRTYTHAYATASNCAPSRASMMSGKWSPRHGMFTVASSERGRSEDRKLIPVTNTQTIGTEHELISEYLKRNGYMTIHAGKWHISPDPLQRGFDINIGGGHNGAPRSYYPPFGNVPLDTTSGNSYLTDVIMEKVIKELASTTQPFFLNYAPYAVHTPIQPKRDLLKKYNGKQGWHGQENPEYATMVENVDRNIGILLDQLNEIGVMENTLIFFMSDNGGLYGITKQKPLRAGKGAYYEGGVRIPFVMKWGNQFRGTSTYPISNLDIFPTIMEAIKGAKKLMDLDGSSLISMDTSQTRKLFWHFPIYLQAYNKSDNENRDSLFRTRPGSTIRFGDWKLHHYYEDDAFELYNLREDPSERTNLAETEPEKLQEGQNLLKKWLENTNAPIPSTPNPEYQSK